MTTGLAGSAGPAPSALERELDALVRGHVGRLNDAGALDAGNGDVLDRMIDQVVARRLAEIDAEAIRRREALNGQVARTRAGHGAASSEQDVNLRRARAAAARLDAMRRRLGDEPEPGIDDDGPAIDVRALRAHTARQRAAARRDQKAALAAVRVRTGSALRIRRDTAARRAEAAERLLEARRGSHQRAIAELDRARADYRGASAASGAAPSADPRPVTPVTDPRPVTSAADPRPVTPVTDPYEVNDARS